MKIHIYPKSMLETVWQQDKLLFTPEAEQPPLCLRCGQPLDHRLVINALSRYADVHICEACGMDEALRDANRCPLPLTCLLYTSPSPRDVEESRMPSSA